MDLKKLPPSMLALLGLGCPGFQACLSPPVDSAEVSTSDVDSNTVGPCLSPPAESSESEVGPCLSPTEETFGTESSTGTGTGSGSGSGTDTSTGTGNGSGSGTDTGTSSDSGSDGSGSTVGPCLAPPGVQPDDASEPLALHHSPEARSSSRRAALERVLARNGLPADVAARLLATNNDSSDLD